MVDTRQVVQASGTPAARGRLAEVAALFASSADFAIGMPLDTTFRITGAALRLAAMLQLPESDRKDFYYLCLVRLMGCTVDNSQFAAAMGDEMEASRRMAAVDMASPTDMLPVLLGLRAGESLMRRASGLLTTVAFGAGMRSHIAGHCEVSQLLTDGLELGPRIRQTLDFTYERGDGCGAPTGSRAGRSRTSHGCSRPATTPPSRTWRGARSGSGTRRAPGPVAAWIQRWPNCSPAEPTMSSRAPGHRLHRAGRRPLCGAGRERKGAPGSGAGGRRQPDLPARPGRFQHGHDSPHAEPDARHADREDPRQGLLKDAAHAEGVLAPLA